MTSKIVLLAIVAVLALAAIAAYVRVHAARKAVTLMASGHWPGPMPAVPLSFPPTGDPVLVGAGDIADCADLSGAQATAKLIEQIPGEVFTAGDDAYPAGTAQQFHDCYDPTWGRFKNRTRPSPGNHEFHSGGATPYFDYFGAAAGDPLSGFYSYDVAAWHIISLNSECQQVGGCQPGSTQEQWLRHDLQTHPAACTLAYWHKPLFSSGGTHGNDPEMKPFWDDLYAARATVVVNGHDHDYERFAPQNPDGAPDPSRGIREFVVGTGGKSHRPFATPLPTSEVRDDTAYGVLKLTLHPKSYDWRFIPEPGHSFHDSGSGSCQQHTTFTTRLPFTSISPCTRRFALCSLWLCFASFTFRFLQTQEIIRSPAELNSRGPGGRTSALDGLYLLPYSVFSVLPLCSLW